MRIINMRSGNKMTKPYHKENLEHDVHKRISITLPEKLVEKIDGLAKNRSAFISKACISLVEYAEKKRLYQAMVQRCKDRYQEDVKLADDFFKAEQEAWDEYLT